MIARLFGRGKSRPVEEEDAFEPGAAALAATESRLALGHGL